MIKVKQLYVKFSDDDGHSYLVRKEDAFALTEVLERIEESYSEHDDEFVYYEQIEDAYNMFGVRNVEGEEVFIVLPEDVIKEK